MRTLALLVLLAVPAGARTLVRFTTTTTTTVTTTTAPAVLPQFKGAVELLKKLGELVPKGGK